MGRYQNLPAAPPIPQSVTSSNGKSIFTKEDIEKGQNIWQEMGGMEVGSVWGHGSYVAPNWSADWLHREAVFVLDKWVAFDFNKKYSPLKSDDQALLKARLQKMYRTKSKLIHLDIKKNVRYL